MTLERFLKIGLFIGLLVTFTSCVSNSRLMREPNVRVRMNAQDFEFSPQLTGEAKQVRVLGVDWKRLFGKTETGAVDGGGLGSFSIPIIGDLIINPTSSYALFDLMNKNTGYDVVFYPQYHTRIRRPFLGLGFIYSKTEVTVTARLARIAPAESK
ncbi:MAG: hypothetical protein ACRBFS_16720 [Aureispira sp.]